MNLRALDLNLLLIFDAIMQERHVSRAAERIGRSQSAVSHSLKKLRQVLNDDLFVRTAGEMDPTPRAMELAQPISSALADLQGALDSYLHFDPGMSQRHFNIGMSDATAFMFLPGLIKEFRAAAPNAAINVRNISAARGYHLLRIGELDCVVLGNAPEVSDYLVSEKILTEKFLCAMWNHNPLLKNPLTLDTFLSCQHLQISLDGVSPGQVDIALDKMGLKRNVAATIPHYLVVPWILTDTDLIVTCGEAPLIAMAGTSAITLAKPPIDIPDVVFSLVTDQRVRTDPGNTWLRSIIVKRADDMQNQKKELYKKNARLFS